jgi:NAD(P)-dependent dehydrogenase (short-subunit alcohol dehydrogenase family)
MLKRSVFITGGTSGLGKELAILFLKNGFTVVATGRRNIDLPGFEEEFKLFRTDFSDLRQTSETIKQICKTYSFDLVINNAGILSPPILTMTGDGNEYTFQVNYLAHLLINEIIIKNHNAVKPLLICTITSPVYRIVKSGKNLTNTVTGYEPLIAYSYSKLLVAVMCRDLQLKYPDRNLVCFSFNPGIFHSGIYRMQSRFFGFLYRVAAPFMRNPLTVASVLFEILMGTEPEKGVIYNIRKKKRKLPYIDTLLNEIFNKECYNKINPFLNSM